MSKQTGTLYLIPNTLGEEEVDNVIPPLVKKIINNIDIYIVEEIRSARRFLKKAGLQKSIDELIFYELNEHTQITDSSHYLDLAKQGKNTGLISEAGCPVIADPGFNLIKAAHAAGIRVVPLTGPSSILLSLMASGFSGQQFTFHGYLPKNKNERVQKLRELENTSRQKKQTQLFIETPYRNIQLLEDILSTCNTQTQLCIACDITLEHEYIYTCSIGEWKKLKPDINKRPAVFLISAY